MPNTNNNNQHDLSQEYLNYKYNMSVVELQTSIGLLKENYETHASYKTLTEIEKLINLLIEKDPEHKEEYLNDLTEVLYEQKHTIFNSTDLYASKIRTIALNRTVEEYIENCIPDSYCSVLECYIFE